MDVLYRKPHYSEARYNEVELYYFLSFFSQFELSHFFRHFSGWIEGNLYAQLLLQFNTDTFETLQTL